MYISKSRDLAPIPKYSTLKYEDFQHYVLRLPPRLATKMKEMVKKNTVHNTSVKMIGKKHGVFRMNKEEYHCVLFKYPSIIEAYKSIDHTNYYKIGNINNVLRVFDRKPLKSKKKLAKLQTFTDKNEEESFYTVPSGITPPLANTKYEFEKRNEPLKKKEVTELVDLYESMLRDDEKNIDIEPEVYQTEEEMKMKRKNQGLFSESTIRKLEETPQNQVSNSLNIPRLGENALHKSLAQEWDNHRIDALPRMNNSIFGSNFSTFQIGGQISQTIPTLSSIPQKFITTNNPIMTRFAPNQGRAVVTKFQSPQSPTSNPTSPNNINQMASLQEKQMIQRQIAIKRDLYLNPNTHPIMKQNIQKELVALHEKLKNINVGM